DQATAIARGRAFFSDRPTPAAATLQAEGPAPRSPPVFPMSSPKRIDTVRVTDFKQFLRSPYLYYLQRVLRLERVRDDAWEIDAKGFGDLLHGVLEHFARSDQRDSQAAKRIEEVVLAGLREQSRNRFGERPLPAVRLQLQQLERRLVVFAARQAEVARQGWRIHEVELKLQGAFLDVDGASVAITGRVDRIDRHATSGHWRILDYKSGDEGNEPRKAHVNKNGWLDLQLPLYRHFLRERLTGEIELGYFAIPRKLEECGVYLANFQAQELEAALDEARRLLRAMLAGDFSRIGRAAPTDRVQRALCGLSLLSLDDEVSDEAAGDDEECAE
ncbi:MAG: PD-(D/E)XK nuclease family protein, partial [Planctomycetota bacterium]